MNLYINAKRNGYDPEQCGNTMTAGELIEFLQQFEDATPVFLKYDGGYTYGSISEQDFEDDEENDFE